MTASVLQEFHSDTASVVVTISAGSTIVVWANCDDTHSATVADDRNGSYGAALETQNDTTNHDKVAMFAFVGAAGGSTTITMTAVGSSFFAIQGVEVGGVSAVDGHISNLQAGPGTGTDAITSTGATNANKPALVIGLSYDSTSANPPTAGTGYTTGAVGLTNEARTENKRITTSGSSQEATFTSIAGRGADRYLSFVIILDETSASSVARPVYFQRVPGFHPGPEALSWPWVKPYLPDVPAPQTSVIPMPPQYPRSARVGPQALRRPRKVPIWPFSTGLVAISGDIAAALSALTADAAGSEVFTGTIAASASSVTGASAGLEVFTGTASASVSSVTGASAGSEIFTGTIAAQLSSVVANLAGWIEITGTIAAQLSSVTGLSSGSEIFTGTVSAAVSSLTAALDGWIEIIGSISAVVSSLVATESGQEIFTGTQAATVSALQAVLAGESSNGGTIAAALSALEAAASGGETFTGTQAATLSSLAAALVGAEQFSGALAAALQSIVGASAGQEVFSGAIDGALQSLQGASAGTDAFVGTIAASVAPLAAAGAGAEVFVGVLAGAVSPLAGASSGTANLYLGTIAAAVTPLGMVGAGGNALSGTIAAQLSPLFAELFEHFDPFVPGPVATAQDQQVVIAVDRYRDVTIADPHLRMQVRRAHRRWR